MREDHMVEILSLGYKGKAEFLEDILKNFDEVWDQPNGKLMLVKRSATNIVAVVWLDPYDKFYGVTTAYTEKPTRDLSKNGENIKVWP